MKRLLTPEFVNEVSPPEKGERWIADTKVRNFGLRLWATKSGGSKAFCIRVGSSKRQTFDPYEILRYNFFRHKELDPDSNLGAFLNSARNWAVREIEKFKDPFDEITQLRKEEQENIKYFKNYIKKMTLEQAAQNYIEGRKKLGAAEAYTDQLDQLFHQWEANKIKKTPLAELDAEIIAKSLVNQKYPAGNIRALRSFIGQIYSQASEFGMSNWHFSQKLGQACSEEMKKNYTVRFPELLGLNNRIYEELFNSLESNEEQWPQAMCIRLFFEFGAPLTRLMSAKWCEIHDGYWYPYEPNERGLWFEAREPVSETAKILLDKLGEKIRTNFAQSDYWFPSPNSKSVPHITTVDRLWKRTVKDIGFEGIPLRDFAMTKRNPTNLSELGYFLNVYKNMLRREKNMVKMSKFTSRKIKK